MPKNLWRAVLIAVVCIALVAPARAESISTAADQVIAGIVVVSAAVAVGVTFLILHEKHKSRSISGCVTSDASGMKVTDDRDKKSYALSGDTAGVKPGERMMLEGRRRTEANAAGFDVQKMDKDLGLCQP